jgi:hypothetical protein
MTTGSFKYNPFVLNQVKQLGSNKEQVSDIDSLIGVHSIPYFGYFLLFDS